MRVRVTVTVKVRVRVRVRVRLHDEVQPVDAVPGRIERRAALQRRQLDQVRGGAQ